MGNEIHNATPWRMLLPEALRNDSEQNEPYVTLAKIDKNI